MSFPEKGLPVILRPFRGSLDVKWGCGIRSKSKKRETQNFLGPPPLRVGIMFTFSVMIRIKFRISGKFLGKKCVCALGGGG